MNQFEVVAKAPRAHTPIDAPRSQRWLPLAIFFVVVVLHAIYVRHTSATLSDGWADTDIAQSGLWGFGPYFGARDYYMGFSYGLSAAFAAWAIRLCVIRRRNATVAGAAGGVTLAGALLAGGCFLIGCCGSPMLSVYLAVFGGKALGLAKPLMALITLLAISCGYWCLRRRFRRGACLDDCCA
jgi:hypothetical protein